MESIPSSFKLTLLVVALLTAVSFTGLVLLAFFGSAATEESEIPHLQALLSATCDFGFKAGFGGLLGLLGAKTS
jgi:hypothetical protein